MIWAHRWWPFPFLHVGILDKRTLKKRREERESYSSRENIKKRGKCWQQTLSRWRQILSYRGWAWWQIPRNEPTLIGVVWAQHNEVWDNGRSSCSLQIMTCDDSRRALAVNEFSHETLRLLAGYDCLQSRPNRWGWGRVVSHSHPSFQFLTVLKIAKRW